MLLEVKELGVDFKNRQGEYVSVVKDISFSVKRGEIVGLVGESGSGKSVTALSILKLLPYPKAKHSENSQIIFEGNNLLKADEIALRKIRGKDIAYIFQEPLSSLNPLRTIGNQIIENIKIHRKISNKRAYAKAVGLLKKVGIPNPRERMNAYPFELSGGQRQRVMIAMAICNNPKLLIADEPTTALDVTIQAQIIELLLGLCKNMNMAMIFISHNLCLVKKIANKICVMKNGEIVEESSASNLFLHPKNTYTKELIDALRYDIKNSPKFGEVLLSTNQLKVSYPIKRNFWGKVTKSIVALNNVNIQLCKGETLGIVGESGSGKTTLGMCLANLIKYEGKVQLNKHTQHSDIQIVFQDPFNSLNPRMNVLQLVEEGVLVKYPNMTKEDRYHHVVQVLKDVKINDADLYKYPHEFSGGQRQRIAIARALAVNPDVIVLDEPTSALDVTIQKQILSLLLQLQKQKQLSYIFISHDINAVKFLADRIAVMKDGQIVEIQETRNVINNPQAEYTKELILSSII